MCKSLKRKRTCLTSKCEGQGSSLLYLGSGISKGGVGGVGEESGRADKQGPGHAELVLFPEPMGTQESKQRKQNTE